MVWCVECKPRKDTSERRPIVFDASHDDIARKSERRTTPDRPTNNSMGSTASVSSHGPNENHSNRMEMRDTDLTDTAKAGLEMRVTRQELRRWENRCAVKDFGVTVYGCVSIDAA